MTAFVGSLPWRYKPERIEDVASFKGLCPEFWRQLAMLNARVDRITKEAGTVCLLCGKPPAGHMYLAVPGGRHVALAWACKKHMKPRYRPRLAKKLAGEVAEHLERLALEAFEGEGGAQ